MAVLAIPIGKSRLMLADKGYDGDAGHQSPLLKGVRPVIPRNANRFPPAQRDFQQY